jgi:CBS domain containing-hemolysin-like protein
MSTAFNLLLAVLLVLLNGFFVAAEFALVKVRSTRVAQLAGEGRPSARMALHAVRHLDAYLSATQLGITLASIALGWIGEPAVARLLEPLFDRLRVPGEAAHAI